MTHLSEKQHFSTPYFKKVHKTCVSVFFITFVIVPSDAHIHVLFKIIQYGKLSST